MCALAVAGILLKTPTGAGAFARRATELGAAADLAPLLVAASAALLVALVAPLALAVSCSLYSTPDISFRANPSHHSTSTTRVHWTMSCSPEHLQLSTALSQLLSSVLAVVAARALARGADETRAARLLIALAVPAAIDVS